MPIVSYTCPQCNALNQTDDSLCGEIKKCPFCGEESLVPIPGVYPGMKIGDFIVEKQLGVGGMGEVWLAKQEKLDRHVALKILSPKYTSNRDFVERFLNEVRNTAKLEHPNIVTAFHAGVENNIYYMAISYIRGETVFDKIKDGVPLSEQESLKIVKSIASALDYAWSEYKILHRDIKPSNIMLDKNSVPKLMDMGISKSLDQESSLTMAGMMIGTPYYVSPEQALGQKDIDFRADIYSLGATLYHMVTGTVPYDADTAMGIVSKHISEPLPDPKNYNPLISEQTVSLIKIMMAKDKNDRPSSWKALIKDVERVLNGEFPITPLPLADKTIIANSAANEATELTPFAEIQKQRHTLKKDELKDSCNDLTISGEVREKKKSHTLLWISLAVLFSFLFFVFVIAAFVGYRYIKAYNQKRKDVLPTEILPKHKNSALPINTQDDKVESDTPTFSLPEKVSEMKPEEKNSITQKDLKANLKQNQDSSLSLEEQEKTTDDKRNQTTEDRIRPNW